MNILDCTHTAFLHGFRGPISGSKQVNSKSLDLASPAFLTLPYPTVLIYQRGYFGNLYTVPPTDPGLFPQKPTFHTSHLKLFHVIVIISHQSFQFPISPALEPQTPNPLCSLTGPWPLPIQASIPSIPSPTSCSHLNPVTLFPASHRPCLERSLRRWLQTTVMQFLGPDRGVALSQAGVMLPPAPSPSGSHIPPSALLLPNPSPPLASWCWLGDLCFAVAFPAALNSTLSRDPAAPSASL